MSETLQPPPTQRRIVARPVEPLEWGRLLSSSGGPRSRLSSLVRWIVRLGILYAVVSAGAGLYLTTGGGFFSRSPLLVRDGWKRIDIPGANGVNLAAWYRGNGKQPLAILAHSFSGTASDGRELADFLTKRAFDVLLFDFRGHGQSSGFTCGFGVPESRDVEAVLQWALESRGSLEGAVWVGHSLGAAAFLLARSAPPISAILVEPYATAELLVDDRCRELLHVGVRPVGTLALWVAELRLGRALADIRPGDELERFAASRLLTISSGPERPASQRGIEADIVATSGDLELHSLVRDAELRQQVEGFLAGPR